MVFGNRGADSATGVLFTRDPATGEPPLYGDVLFDAQGEDVVAGTHRTEPIAVLDERLPEVAAELRAAATRLEHHFRDLCDIEFTIESGRLWLLQVRVGKRSPAAALRIAVDMAEDASFPLTRGEAVERVRPLLADPPTTTSARSSSVRPLRHGPAGLAGDGQRRRSPRRPEAAQAAAADGAPAILVRAETSPDDVHGMAAAAGILTSRGGLASHAAVVARGWGIPAVVGATGLDRLGRPGRRSATGRSCRATSSRSTAGPARSSRASIPGTTEVVPEVRTLLAWAAELGIDDRAGAPPRPNRVRAIGRAVRRLPAR